MLTELKRRNVLRVTFAYLVVGWLLTEVLTTVLPTLDAPAWMSRAVILMFALGFIPAVALSWSFRLTPQGIKRQSDTDDNVETPGMKRKFDYFAIASVMVLVVVLAILGARPTSTDQSGASSQINNASVAVLPFVNMSNDEDNEYFSDGLTETLLHMLSQIPNLQVAARTSSFAFKGKNQDVREIAEALQVAHILEGSVQRAGNRVRITAQLIRADDGFHVWSSIFDRTIDDIFAIQDEIAAEVGGALSASLLGSDANIVAPGAGTKTVDAWDLYVRALEERASFSFRGLKVSENLLKGAIAIDPDYLDAKTELASNYVHQYETGLIDVGEANSQIAAMTDQVLAERPMDPLATALRIYVQTMLQPMEGDSSAIANAIEKLDQLVRDNPADQRIRALLGRLLLNEGLYDRALEIYLKALERDSYNAQIHYELGLVYASLQRPQEARAALEKALEIEPRQPNALMSLAELDRRAGDGVAFLQYMLKALAVDPQDQEIPGWIAVFLYQLSLVEEGDDFRDQVLAIAPTSVIAYQVELARGIATGDEAASIASARRAIEDDIENRKFAYGSAVQHLLRRALINGRIEEEIAWLENAAPGIFDINAASAPAKYRVAQIIALEAWFASLPRAELNRRIGILQANVPGIGPEHFEDQGLELTIMAMHGDVDQAVEFALTDVLPESVLLNLGWRESLGLAHFQDLGADDRVQAGLQVWRDEQAAQSTLVGAYLAELSAIQ
jgi:TolB-like protein/Flp pilus assembly protein TadD